ncbi:diaminopimelate epimerase [Geosporobacter ferrireducens]|uniref:Diaminopimelate epimerase n=1 Tax=Geosporobacter ferrireducens TaxID=1424294 RepID=A0A1D8GBY9_9FIRM|nr:diaminopimelate epimerase [Geosporobacter ferrireducens]AOT68424.1 diaminopimelate epimerase [Geosporobacter ferrireducens]MTI53879.1 diaminopimelate epimerase [Geosporobacter ferrireducens]
MLKFSKMQGAGNDFILINGLEQDMDNLSGLAKKLCDRHFGIGADGLMAVAHSEVADIQMIYYNSDGSRGEMCGNGIRCFSRFVFEKGIVTKPSFQVETLSGIKEIGLKLSEGQVKRVAVDMGPWNFSPVEIPVETNKPEFIREPISVEGIQMEISCVLMGVPHAVIFVDRINETETVQWGSFIEKLKIFPKKINVNFVKVVNERNILVDTWERGAGKTLACGTGACASVIIAHHLGLCDTAVNVKVAGGELQICIENENRIMMEGKADFICDGLYYL